eukprot:scaffold4815_cov363-Prasinococcus_capsulatus_cf.AAC.1
MERESERCWAARRAWMALAPLPPKRGRGCVAREGSGRAAPPGREGPVPVDPHGSDRLRAMYTRD